MARRKEGPNGDASLEDQQRARRNTTAERRSPEDDRSDHGEKTDRDTTKTEIAAGDLGDELADFA